MVANSVKGLSIGLALLVSACASNISAPAPIARGSSVDNCDDQVTVDRGDTLSAIARRCGHSVPELAGANSLTPPYPLTPGQTLSMPSEPVYTVRRGDNLYRIALAHGMSTQELATLNSLAQPYTIHPGQELRVQGTPQNYVAQGPVQYTPPPQNTGPQHTPPANNNRPPVRQPAYQQPSADIPANRRLDFVWPVDGQVVQGFRAGDTRIDGIRISANFGAPVRAAADGEVVYVGNEIAGYGELVLIRHAHNWVTAYALNSSIRVNKNDQVRAGQHIADVGRASADGNPVLHFEIRRGTNALNPVDHLPARGSAS